MAFSVPRVQVVPQPDEQLSFQVEGSERLRWQFATFAGIALCVAGNVLMARRRTV